MSRLTDMNLSMAHPVNNCHTAYHIDDNYASNFMHDYDNVYVGYLWNVCADDANDVCRKIYVYSKNVVENENLSKINKLYNALMQVPKTKRTSIGVYVDIDNVVEERFAYMCGEMNTLFCDYLRPRFSKKLNDDVMFATIEAVYTRKEFEKDIPF